MRGRRRNDKIKKKMDQAMKLENRSPDKNEIIPKKMTKKEKQKWES